MKKKKILIIILFIWCIIGVTFIVHNQYKKNVEVSQQQNEIIVEVQNENISISENTIEENIENVDNDNSIINKESNSVSNNTKIQEEVNLSVDKNTQESKQQESEKTNSKIQMQETKTQSSIASQTQTQVPSQASSQSQTQNQAQTQSQSQARPQTQSTTNTQTLNQNKESFKINDSIISKMKNIINANPSSYMKKLGYNIVVDSSIVNKTTGFTFTETRVKNAIINSFGTIRIYARDYYIGNELRWTESFIL